MYKKYIYVVVFFVIIFWSAGMGMDAFAANYPQEIYLEDVMVTEDASFYYVHFLFDRVCGGTCTDDSWEYQAMVGWAGTHNTEATTGLYHIRLYEVDCGSSDYSDIKSMLAAGGACTWNYSTSGGDDVCYRLSPTGNCFAITDDYTSGANKAWCTNEANSSTGGSAYLFWDKTWSPAMNNNDDLVLKLWFYKANITWSSLKSSILNDLWVAIGTDSTTGDDDIYFKWRADGTTSTSYGDKILDHEWYVYNTDSRATPGTSDTAGSTAWTLRNFADMWDSGWGGCTDVYGAGSHGHKLRYKSYTDGCGLGGDVYCCSKEISLSTSGTDCGSSSGTYASGNTPVGGGWTNAINTCGSSGHCENVDGHGIAWSSRELSIQRENGMRCESNAGCRSGYCRDSQTGYNFCASSSTGCVWDPGGNSSTASALATFYTNGTKVNQFECESGVWYAGDVIEQKICNLAGTCCTKTCSNGTCGATSGTCPTYTSCGDIYTQWKIKNVGTTGIDMSGSDNGTLSAPRLGAEYWRVADASCGTRDTRNDTSWDGTNNGWGTNCAEGTFVASTGISAGNTESGTDNGQLLPGEQMTITCSVSTGSYVNMGAGYHLDWWTHVRDANIDVDDNGTPGEAWNDQFQAVSCGTTQGIDDSSISDATVPSTSDDWTDNWVNYSPASVTLTPTDTGPACIQGTWYCVDTANTCSPATSGTSVSVTCASACTQYVRYYTKDNASNTETVKSKRVRQDLQNPTTTDNWTDNWTNTSPVNITLTPSDGSGSGLQATYYCVDTANTCAPGTSGTSVSVTCSAGSTCTQYVRYYSKDNVNNSESVNSKRVRQDRIAPTTTDNGNTSWVNADQTVTLTPTDDASGSGVASTKYCVDTTNSCSPATTGISVSVTCASGSNCQQYVRYYSTDSAANTESTHSVLIKIDKTIPSFTLTGWSDEATCNTTPLTDNESYNDSRICLKYPASDTGSGLTASPYTYYFGTDCNASPATSSASSTYDTGAGGMADATKNCFRVTASDVAGNVSSVSTFTFMYNTITPSWKYPGAAGSYVDAFYGGGTIRTYGSEQRFYGASFGGVFYALLASDGSEKWKCELDTSPDDGAITNCGGSDYGSVSSPPLIFNGAIYLGTEDGYVLKLTDNGANWTLNASRDLGACSIQSATMTITMSGATKILAGCGANMYALNDDATFTNWANWTTNPRPLTGSVTRSIPAYATQPGGVDPYLYVATQNGTLADASYGNLYKIDINNGTILLTFADSTDFTGFLTLRNYFGDGNQWLYAGGANSNKFYVIKTSSIPATCTGASCVSFAASSGFEGGAAVSSGGSVIYAGNNNGTLYRLNFNGTTLTSPYNFNAGGATNAIKYGITFRQATGRLYFGTDAGLFFIITDNGASFTENMRYQTGNSVDATPAVNSTAGKVVVPGVIGRIFSFGL